MQKAGTLQANIDKRRLHAGQHARNFTLVEIADNAATIAALDVDFLQQARFEQRRAHLARRDVHQDFSRHGAPCHTRMPERCSRSAVSNSGRPITPE